MKHEKVFWGYVADKLIKASLIGVTLTGIVVEAVRLLVEFKVVAL